jgi:hypothetical protein
MVMQPPSGTVTFLLPILRAPRGCGRSDRTRCGPWSPITTSGSVPAIEHNGGYGFATGGDEFVAAFGRAGDAVAAAEQAQGAIADLPDIKVRMEINTGEVRLRRRESR